ncbi:GNAT family N-acetyltransferase [Aeromonas veronii]|uniref:GNAT family N-acetyltransferase n=1 Tax=Aeromonas veronii TaxID=654 RepID=UPI001F431B68|nr:GNAT family N-acetyltransferase [Aeromonas veronii]MCF5766183.1 GNAT family N-acetyltransferase [Aeromonas veronii]
MLSERLEIVTYSREFLDLSWHWLNDPEIKKLTGTPDFTKQQQEDFFASLPRSNYLVWGLMYQNKPIGVIGLKNINDVSAEYFGYIGEKSCWGKGFFSKILALILCECKKLNINYVYLHVAVDNHMANKSYIKNGFVIEPDKCTDEQNYMSMKVSNYAS